MVLSAILFMIPKNSSETHSYGIEITDTSEDLEILPNQSGGYFFVNADGTQIKSVIYFGKSADGGVSPEGITYEFAEGTVKSSWAYNGAKVFNDILYIFFIDTENNDEVKIFYTKSADNSIQAETSRSLPKTYKLNNKYANSIIIDKNETIFFINSENAIDALDKDGNACKICLTNNNYIPCNPLALCTNVSNTTVYALAKVTNNEGNTSKKVISFAPPKTITGDKSCEVNYTVLEFTNESPDTNLDTFYFLTDEIFVTYTGAVYSVDSKKCLLKSDKASWEGKNVSVFSDIGGSYIIRINKDNKNIIDAFEEDVSTKIKEAKLDEALTVQQLACSSCNAIAIVKDSSNKKYIKVLKTEDFANIPVDEPPGAGTGGGNTGNGAETGDTPQISSNSYEIDTENKVIKNVPILTTALDFIDQISCINCDKNDLTFLTYLGDTIKTGRLGTGATVTITKDGVSITFQIVVTGDTTGEGNLNVRDVDTLKSHLGEKSKIYGEYLIAADQNGDGLIDTLDLLSLQKLVKPQ